MFCELYGNGWLPVNENAPNGNIVKHNVRISDQPLAQGLATNVMIFRISSGSKVQAIDHQALFKKVIPL